MVVGQSRRSLPELTLEEVILVDKIADDLGLLPDDPVRDGGEEERRGRIAITMRSSYSLSASPHNGAVCSRSNYQAMA